MQSTHLTFVLIALVAIGTRAAADHTRLDREEYLPLPPSGNSGYREQLYQLLLKDKRPPGIDTRVMLDDFAGMINDTQDEFERNFYQEMRSFGNFEARCSHKLLDYIYLLLSLGKQYPVQPAVENYIRLLRGYGREKLWLCADYSERNFWIAKSHLEDEVERALDELYKVYGNFEPREANTDLYGSSKRLEPRSDNFNVRRMVEVAQKWVGERAPDHKQQRPDDEARLLSVFMTDQCARLEASLGDVFGPYNLAKALGARATSGVSSRFLKCNEYHRLCLAWATEEAKANIERQLGATLGAIKLLPELPKTSISEPTPSAALVVASREATLRPPQAVPKARAHGVGSLRGALHYLRSRRADAKVH